MNKLAVLRNEASVGSHVTLRLTRGDDVAGHIAQLDDTRVSLDLDGKRVTIFADILAGWELSPPSDDRKAGVAEPQDRSSSGDAATDEGKPEAAVKLALARIDAKFSEAVNRARLRPVEPDFRFPDEVFPSHEVEDIRRDLDRARNKYQYALQVKEPARLNDIVKQILVPLTQEYPRSAGIRSLLGRVLLKLDRRSEAMEHLSAAAILSEAPDQWLAVASAATDDTATECYALRRYFGITAPTDAKEAWFRYLADANPIDLTGAGQVIDRWSSAESADGSDPDHMLSESLIHLLLSSGSPSLAQQAATNLVHDNGRLPTGWQDALDRATVPSDELRSVERRLTRPSPVESPARPSRSQSITSVARAVVRPTPAQIQALQRRFQHGGEDIRHGRIKSFGNQRFGFIQEDAGDAVFFRVHDVTDEGLQEALLLGSWRTSGEVEFKVHPSPGHKYRHATGIVRTSTESLLQRSRSHLDAGQLAQAMGCVRRALQANPTDGTARLLEKQVRLGLQEQLRDQATGLPKPTGPYARAKRAQLVEQDPEKAETLLKQAIRDHDKKQSAIKDLASLLHQHGRSDEAISLLTKYARQFGRDIAYDNMLATFYQHLDRHDVALRVLTRILQSTTVPAKKIPLLKRIAYSYFRSSRYDDAERALQNLLSIDPQDRTAARWLIGLEDARNAKVAADASEIIDRLGTLSEEGVELSPLAQAAIEQCTYDGVDPKKLQVGTIDDADIKRVVELARELGTKRPRDRAGFYLSAAALCNRDANDGHPGRIYAYLRSYFASMATASWIENRPADVVRSYYIESLSLASENDNLDEAWRSLFRYIVTFSREPLHEDQAGFPRERRSRQKYTDVIRKALEMMVPEAQPGWREGLFAVGSQSSFAKTAIGDAVHASRSLPALFGGSPDGRGQQGNDVRESWRAHCREYARSHRKRLNACETMRNYQATVAAMEDLRSQLAGFSDSTYSEVDRRRLFSLIDIVEPARALCSASDFEERERNYWLVINHADGFRKEVINNPTQYSHEGLLPIADHIKSLIEEEYFAMAQTSGAELSLQLLVGQYVRRQNGELRLQIEVSNKSGCSPASSVRIRFGPNNSEYFVGDNESKAIPTLRGGRAEVIQMIVRPRAAALKDRAFPIKAVATYQNTLGEAKCTDEYTWTVRLYPDDAFQPVENLYAPFAEGGPVDKPDMFVGRDELLDRLERSLLAGSASKSIVMFGQKRAGKSSLIEHLRRRLTRSEQVVSVSFSLQDIAPELSIPAFLHRILQCAAEELEELRFDGRDVPDFSPPTIDEMESHPTPRFHSAMASLVRAMRRRPVPLDFVFLIDEFTDIFKEIKRERVPPQFMKAWKAIIEKKYFASVLVGQDIMPEFKNQFPNEFGVTEDIRVTYLDDAAATTLIEKPIGKESFAGRAVTTVLELTAGSPYYTMMFCARLVDYMNTTRSVIVTEADIRAVEEQMLRGERRLEKDKFDNLLSAGDGKEDSGIDPDDTYRVCVEIACGSGKELWCPPHALRAIGEDRLEHLLTDLETREVVERKGDAYRLRVGLFKDWLMERRG